MRKRCKRKVYTLSNPISLAIEGACITTDDKLDELLTREAEMVQAIETSAPDALHYFNGLCEQLGIAETMAKHGIGPEVLDACKAAQVALIKLKTRYSKWGKWDITDGERHALRELREWHHLQRTSVSRGEYERWIKRTADRMRSRAPDVEVI